MSADCALKKDETKTKKKKKKKEKNDYTEEQLTLLCDDVSASCNFTY